VSTLPQLTTGGAVVLAPPRPSPTPTPSGGDEHLVGGWPLVLGALFVAVVLVAMYKLLGGRHSSGPPTNWWT